MSLRLAIVTAIARHLVKPRLRRTATPAAARREFELAAQFFFPRPAHLCRRVRRNGPLRLDWVSTRPLPPGRLVLYFHGGAYVAGSPATHQGLLGWLSEGTGCEVCAPRYRLAPEAPFPAAFEDACAAWTRLEALGYAPGDIVLGGDSAGGGLALALMAWLCARGRAPAGLFAFSPWTDLAGTGASLTANARKDALLPAERLPEVAQYSLAGQNPRDPRISPLYAGFAAPPPPVLLQVARSEILFDDAARMAQLLRDAGGSATLDVLPDAPHVVQLMGPRVPEAGAAVARAARFARACHDAAQAGSGVIARR